MNKLRQLIRKSLIRNPKDGTVRKTTVQRHEPDIDFCVINHFITLTNKIVFFFSDLKLG